MPKLRKLIKRPGSANTCIPVPVDDTDAYGGTSIVFTPISNPFLVEESRHRTTLIGYPLTYERQEPV